MKSIVTVNQEYVSNPFGIYARLRRESPVVWDEALNRWLVFRYEDVKNVVRNPATFTSQRSEMLVPFELRERYANIIRHFSLWFVAKDFDEHARLRGMVEDRFSPQSVLKLSDRVRRLATQLRDDLLAKGGGDFVLDFAFQLPARIITSILGLNPEDWVILKGWADHITTIAGAGASSVQICEIVSKGLEEAKTYFTDLVYFKRKRPADDVISDLACAPSEVTESLIEEIIAQSVLIFWAGHETTQNLISNSLISLQDYPDQMQALTNTPQLSRDAVEEFLRYDSPVQALTRIATADVGLAGAQIKKGDGVMAYIGSANRDPDVFQDPDNLILTRKPTKHLAFGHGPHYCLGAYLARLETSIALELWAPYLTSMRVLSAMSKRKENLVHRGFSSIPVSFDQPALKTANL